jgi:hypothetical protein
LVSTETLPCNAADAGYLAEIYCGGIEVEKETIDELLRLTGGSARKLSVNFERIREMARRRNARIIDVGFLAAVKLHTSGGQFSSRVTSVTARGAA